MKTITLTETHVSIVTALVEREMTDTRLKLVQSGVIQEVADAAVAVLGELQRRVSGANTMATVVDAPPETPIGFAPTRATANLPVVNQKLRKKPVFKPKPIYGQIAALIADGDNEKDIATLCEVSPMVVRIVKGHFKKEIGALRALPARDRKDYIAKWFKDETAPTNGHAGAR